MKRLDKKLPDLRHGLERLAPQRIDVYGNTAPSANPQPLRIGGSFDGRTSFNSSRTRKKRKPHAKHFGQLDLQLLGARAEEFLWQRREQPGAVSAGAIRIDSSAVRQPL